MIVEVKNWLEQAKADLKTARDNIVSNNYYASVLFSQQCAEKGLKAVYIFQNNKIPPKIHDLVELGRQVKAPITVINEAIKLTSTYFSSRYPGAAPEIPVKFYNSIKAESHLKEAEVILKWVEQQTKS